MSCYAGLRRRKTMPSKEKRVKPAKKTKSNTVQHAPKDPELLQEIDKIDAMSSDELREAILNMIVEMDLPQSSRVGILNKDPSEQKKLLISYCMKKDESSSKVNGHNTDEFLEGLRNANTQEEMTAILEQLRVAVGTYQITWLHEFADKDGHLQLLKIVDHFSQEKKDEKNQKVLLNCIRCLKAFMNNRFGLNKMIEIETSLETMYSSIFEGGDQVLMETLKILAPLCLLSTEGHTRVLKALTNQAIKRQIGRFDHIIQSMITSDQPYVQPAVFLFLNSVLAPVEDQNYRIHLRCEMGRAGLENFLDDLGSSISEELEVQLNLYNDLKKEDSDELTSRLQRARVDITDVTDTFRTLHMITQGSKSERPFMSILQHLLLIRDDFYVRPMYFQLIEQCVSHIVLQRDGVDPDFNPNKKINLDVGPIIGSMLTKEHVEEARERALKYEKQLKDEQIKRHELDVQVSLLNKENTELQSTLEKKQKSLEDEIDQLAYELNQATSGIKPPQRTISNEISESSASKQTDATKQVRNSVSRERRLNIPPPPPDLPEIAVKIPSPPPNLPEVAAAGGSGGAAGSSIVTSKQGHKLSISKVKFDAVPGMTHFFWKGINEQDVNEKSIWAKLNEEKLMTHALSKKIESKFVKKSGTVEKDDPKTKIKKLGDKIDSQSPQIISPQAAQNISIFLSAYKVPSEQIKRMIINMDEKLSQQMLSDMLKFLPNAQDIQKLNDLLKNHQFQHLNSAEKFLLVVTKVDRLEARLRTTIFKNNMSEEIAEIIPQIQLIKSTSETIKKSKDFQKVLEYVLVIGNKMNAGTKLAQTSAFHLESLTKLDATKSNDQSSTLMNFIVEAIEEYDSKLLKFIIELEAVKVAARISDENIRTQIRNISIGIEEIRQELTHFMQKDNADSNDKYPKIMSAFLVQAEERLKILKKDLKDMETELHEVINYYAMDPRKVSSEDFFGYIVKFLAMFEKARKENAMLREAKKKEEMRKEIEEATRIKREESKKINASKDEQGISKNITTKDEKLLDNLLFSMQKGDFGPKTRKNQNVRRNSGNLGTKITEGNANKINNSVGTTSGQQVNQPSSSQSTAQPTAYLRSTPKQEIQPVNLDAARPSYMPFTTNKIQSNTSSVTRENDIINNNTNFNKNQSKPPSQQEKQKFFQQTPQTVGNAFSNTSYTSHFVAKPTNVPIANANYKIPSSQSPRNPYPQTRLPPTNESHILDPYAYSWSTNAQKNFNNIPEDIENPPPPPPPRSTRTLSTMTQAPQSSVNSRNSLQQPSLPKKFPGLGETNGTSSGHNSYFKSPNIMTADLNQASKLRNTKPKNDTYL